MRCSCAKLEAAATDTCAGGDRRSAATTAQQHAPLAPLAKMSSGQLPANVPFPNSSNDLFLNHHLFVLRHSAFDATLYHPFGTTHYHPSPPLTFTFEQATAPAPRRATHTTSSGAKMCRTLPYSLRRLPYGWACCTRMMHGRSSGGWRAHGRRYIGRGHRGRGPPWTTRWGQSCAHSDRLWGALQGGEVLRPYQLQWWPRH